MEKVNLGMQKELQAATEVTKQLQQKYTELVQALAKRE